MVSLEQMVAEATRHITRLDPADAFAAVESGDGLIIDIRELAFRQRDGAVPGSVHVPLTKLEWRVAMDSEFRNPSIGGPESRLILMCDGGYSSRLAAANLVRLGFVRAGDVVGGFAGWAGAGLPVVAAPPLPDGLPGMAGPLGAT